MLAILTSLASLLGLELDALKARVQRQAAMWSVIAIFALVAIVFLLVAANSSLSLWFGPVVAPLIIAGTALFLALVVFLVTHIQEGADARRREEERKRAETSALLTSVAITAVPMILKSSLLREVGIPAGGALLAAYLLSRPSARSSGTTTDPER